DTMRLPGRLTVESLPNILTNWPLEARQSPDAVSPRSVPGRSLDKGFNRVNVMGNMHYISMTWSFVRVRTTDRRGASDARHSPLHRRDPGDAGRGRLCRRPRPLDGSVPF